MNNDNFDERQKQMRHSIFTVMYFVLLCYMGFFLTVGDCFESFISLRDLMFTGIILTTTIDIVLMIFKDCYFRRCETKNSIRICFIGWIVIIFLNTSALIKQGIITNGKLNHNFPSFCFTIMWTIISLSFFIKEILNRKKAKTSKEE